MPRNKFWGDQGIFGDSDGDGLTDDFEQRVLGTDPNKAYTDGDGLNDLRERDFGTNPLRADSDRDGLNDGREVIIGTNPQAPDTDGDGTDDLTEVRQGTASAPDSDRDGTPDWVEAARSNLTSDGDELTDAEERWLNTSPFTSDTDNDGQPDDVEVFTLDNSRGPFSNIPGSAGGGVRI